MSFLGEGDANVAIRCIKKTLQVSLAHLLTLVKKPVSFNQNDTKHAKSQRPKNNLLIKP